MASGACACGVPTTAAAPTGGKEGEGVDMRRLLLFQLCKRGGSGQLAPRPDVPVCALEG